MHLTKKRDYVCGEFNAKNRMGGYEGFSPFAVRLQKEEYLRVDLAPDGIGC
jgi:hypothetical protein